MNLTRRPSKFYSPLRYPGGKGILSNFIDGVIKYNDIKDCVYCEPYAGGAGAALGLLFLEKVDDIIVNDLDKSIFSFWHSVVDNCCDFVEKIKETPLTIDEWDKQKEIYKSKTDDKLSLGFSAFYLNRTNRSGIIEAGPIGGRKQEGNWKIDARFNKDELIRRVKKIGDYSSRIQVTNLDGIELLKSNKAIPNLFTYLDPPYYFKGDSLYLNHYENNDHSKLANCLNENNDMHWIMTYDSVQQIKDLYSDRRTYDFDFFYHIDLPKKGKEVLIVSDAIHLSADLK